MNKTLFLLILFTFILRVSVLDKYGIAGDEKYTLTDTRFLAPDGVNQTESIRKADGSSFTSKEFWTPKTFEDFQLAMAKKENGSGAGYFLMAHYWTNIFGVNDFSLRFPSLIFSLLLIIIAFYFGKLLFTERVGLIAATLASVSPLLFNFSLIARNYLFTYFWFALATYALLKILRTDKKTGIWLIIYALSLTLTIFGHHSAYIIYILHLIIFLIEKNYKTIFKLIGAGLPSILIFGSWLMSEGGKYAFEFIEDSNSQYLDWVKEGNLDYSSPTNVLNGFLNTFSSLSLPISSHFYYFSQPKQQLFFIALSILIYVIYKLKLNQFLKIALISILLITPLLLLKQFNPYILTIIIGLGVFYELLSKSILKLKENKNLLYIYLLFFIPLFLLIYYAFKDQTVIRLNARYGGYGYVFLILIMAYGLDKIIEKKNKFTTWFILLFLSGICVFETHRIMTDNSPLYFHYTTPKRIKNPYSLIANKVVEQYALGDTLIICSQKQATKLAGGIDMYPYSYLDAQYLGVYFPKDGKEIVQKIDHNESEKVFLKKKNGEKLLIFDFEDGKYRY